jgi:hypothetical protein
VELLLHLLLAASGSVFVLKPLSSTVGSLPSGPTAHADGHARYPHRRVGFPICGADVLRWTSRSVWGPAGACGSICPPSRCRKGIPTRRPKPDALARLDWAVWRPRGHADLDDGPFGPRSAPNARRNTKVKKTIKN